MTYSPHKQYAFFEWNDYCCDDYTCLLYRLGHFDAKFNHEDGQCQILKEPYGLRIK